MMWNQRQYLMLFKKTIGLFYVPLYAYRKPALFPFVGYVGLKQHIDKSQSKQSEPDVGDDPNYQVI